MRKLTNPITSHPSPAESKGVNGGYASHLVWDSRFVFPIPDGLAPEHAGPLLCAGATVYTALANNNVRPHHRVAVVGIGGLVRVCVCWCVIQSTLDTCCCCCRVCHDITRLLGVCMCRGISAFNSQRYQGSGAGVALVVSNPSLTPCCVLTAVPIPRTYTGVGLPCDCHFTFGEQGAAGSRHGGSCLCQHPRRPQAQGSGRV